MTSLRSVAWDSFNVNFFVVGSPALVADLPVTYLHVFPFSARKGTPAATYQDQVPQPVIKERCRRLRC